MDKVTGFLGSRFGNLFRIEDVWYQPNHILAWLLLPFSIIFYLIVRLRERLYAHGYLPSEALPVPVIVVGNLTVGGTGKTPFVICLCQKLRELGYRPGVLTRGYGAKASYPLLVKEYTRADEAGDEALIIAKHSGVPVVVDPKRIQGGRYLVDAHACDVLVCDDGLQHYAMQRDVEIEMIDGERRYGNGFLLPAGPLREPISRARRCQFHVVNGEALKKGEYRMHLEHGELINLHDSSRRRSLASFSGRSVHAVAGLGNPQRFFTLLENANINFIAHEFRDHQMYSEQQLCFDDGLPIIMTEKDAVKCGYFAGSAMWYLPIRAYMPNKFFDQLKLAIPKAQNGS